MPKDCVIMFEDDVKEIIKEMASLNDEDDF
jgi:hypothetical protein